MPKRPEVPTRRRAGALRRLRGLPWPLLAKIGGGLLVALVIVGLVPPLRNAAALGMSKVILFVASPLAPRIEDFERLPQTSKVMAADGTVLAELDEAQRRLAVDIDDLPDHVTHAVLAAEDQEFYAHSGIDPSAVFRAFLRTATGNTQGGSTITQQLAKINYTAGERTILRKLKEVLYASKLEKKYSKDTLLQRYVNQVYFGEQSYGIEAAAQTFFAKPARELSAAEAALLAGKIRAPSVIDPRKRPAEAKERRDQVLANMAQEGWIDEQQLEAARAEPLNVAPPAAPSESTRAPHFVEYVKREAATIDALGASPDNRSNRLHTGGYTIETTLDPKVFDATVEAVSSQLGEEGDPVAAVASVAPGDGAIRGLFGGLDFASTQLDMASRAGRQAGSAVKPFVYLAALREGIDPRSTFDGTSGRTIPCYRADPVSNYAGEDAGGRITVDEALVKSVNVVFADLGCEVGARNVARTANDAGLPEDAVDKDLGGYFLGGFDGNGVNALEMASAYAAFAAKGLWAEPYAIARITDADGNVVYKHERETKQVFKAEEAGVLTGALAGVIERGTGTAAQIGRPAAGKTGTTQDNVDAWFVGYTPQLSTGVWVGYPEESLPMSSVHGRAVTGGSFPATIFGEVMRRGHEDLPVRALFTASPDQLELEKANPVPPPPPSPSTTAVGDTTTTEPGASTTTTSTTSTSTTTTTARRQTTTTSPPTTTSTTTTSTTTTTAPTTTTASP